MEKESETMKRHGYLYEKVMTVENVMKAVDAYNAKRPVALRREISREYAQRLLDDMKRDFAGVVGKPRRKVIFDGGKRRELQIPSFKSSIAQLALWNICGAFVERRIHSRSYSSRLGMGGHKAFRECSHFVRRNWKGKAKYCFYFDIAKYYRHIDRRIMMDRLATIFKDKNILELFRIVLDSADEGLPIGYPFSHALANLYLTPLYHLVMSDGKVSRGVVYMDNHLFFSKWKKPLFRARDAVVNWLAGVGCAMKRDWQIFPTAARAVRICGFGIRAGMSARLYRRLWRRIMRNLDALAHGFALANYLSLMSRKGWLMAIHKQNTPAIITGGCPW